MSFLIDPIYKGDYPNFENMIPNNLSLNSSGFPNRQNNLLEKVLLLDLIL